MDGWELELERCRWQWGLGLYHCPRRGREGSGSTAGTACLGETKTPERLPHQVFSWQTTPSPLADHNRLCFGTRPKPSVHSSKTWSRILSTPGTEAILKRLLSCWSGCSFPSFACLLAHNLTRGPLCSPSSASLSSGQGTFISLYNNRVSRSKAAGTSPVSKPNPGSKHGVCVTVSCPLLVDQPCPFLKGWGGLANALAVGGCFPKAPALVYQLLCQKVHLSEAVSLLAKKRGHGRHQGIIKS